MADPLFVDSDHDDYRLRPESPAWKLGFQPIPVEKIGPYADPNRASWPIVEAEGVREHPLIGDSPAATSAAGEIIRLPDRLPCASTTARTPQVPDRLRLTGMIGTRIERSTVNRLLAIDVDRLLEGFRHRPGRQSYDGQGARWTSAAGTVLIPSAAVVAVDTTAAGDAFNGGLAWARLRRAAKGGRPSGVPGGRRVGHAARCPAVAAHQG